MTARARASSVLICVNVKRPFLRYGTVLAQAIVKEGVKLVAAGMNPNVDLLHGLGDHVADSLLPIRGDRTDLGNHGHGGIGVIGIILIILVVLF